MKKSEALHTLTRISQYMI